MIPPSYQRKGRKRAYPKQHDLTFPSPETKQENKPEEKEIRKNKQKGTKRKAQKWYRPSLTPPEYPMVQCPTPLYPTPCIQLPYTQREHTMEFPLRKAEFHEAGE
jgi:hypothetical protein